MQGRAPLRVTVCDGPSLSSPGNSREEGKRKTGNKADKMFTQVRQDACSERDENAFAFSAAGIVCRVQSHYAELLHKLGPSQSVPSTVKLSKQRDIKHTLHCSLAVSLVLCRPLPLALPVAAFAKPAHRPDSAASS